MTFHKSHPSTNKGTAMIWRIGMGEGKCVDKHLECSEFILVERGPGNRH